MNIASIRSVTAFLLCACAAGCHSNDVVLYSAVDRAEQTITVPAGSALLLGRLKQALSNSGWKMSVDRGPNVTVGTVGEKTELATADTFKTRYRLVLRQRQVDVCVLPLGEPMVAYDLSVVDNQTGQELMTQSGRGCVSTVADKFTTALQGH